MRGPSRSETRGHAIAGVRATHAHLLVPVLPKMHASAADKNIDTKAAFPGAATGLRTVS